MKNVVRGLIIANLAVYLLQLWLGDVMLVHFALWPVGDYPAGDGVTVGFEPWQLVTSAFLRIVGESGHSGRNVVSG